MLLRHVLASIGRARSRFCRQTHPCAPCYHQAQEIGPYHKPSPSRPLASSPLRSLSLSLHHSLSPTSLAHPLLELLHTLHGADDVRDPHPELVVDDHNFTTCD